MSRIIRLAFAVSTAIALLIGPACLFGQSGGSTGQASAARTNAARPAASTSGGRSAWVMTPIGLNLHPEPSSSSQILAILAWGSKLDVSETQTVGAQTWLHVTTEGGSQGWVVDGLPYVSHQPMSKHIESAYRHLFPAGWTLVSGNPATLTSPAGDPEGVTVTIATSDDVSKLPKVPSSSGHQLGDDSAQTGDKTYVMHTYSLDSGGFESYVEFKEGSTAYIFDFKQAKGTGPDTTLFKTLLGTVLLNPS